MLPLTSAAIVINGVQGTYLHWRGIAQRPGGWTRYNMEAGPPMFAPLLASLVGGMGLLAAVLRREGPGRPMTYRSPDAARRHPAGPGPVPRLRRPRPGPTSGTTSPPGSCWPGWRRRTTWGSSPRPSGRVAEPLLDLLLAQDAEPRVPVLALIDTRLAIGETDGWHYDDLPEDGQAWRDTLGCLDRDAARASRPCVRPAATAPSRRR